MSKTFRYYDFTLTAGSSQVILVDAAYFRVQSATGAVDVTVEGFGTLPGMLVGQGIKDTPFKRLVIRDVSGAANVGTILVASQEFVDNRTYGVSTISGGTIDLTAATQAALNRPQAATGSYNTGTALAANTAEQIFSAASNVNGAVLLTAFSGWNDTVGHMQTFIYKATAPTSVTDGTSVFNVGMIYTNTSAVNSATMPKEVFIPAGQGLYFIDTSALAAVPVTNKRSATYKLL